jgi:hypothetical protein
MPAWDNVQLPGAPAAPSYAAPLLDFSPIGNLQKDYFEGTQQGRTRALQGAFKEGLPKNPDGSLNIGAMSETLAKLGGADAAMPLMQLQIQQQLGQGNANAIGSAAESVNGTTPAQPQRPPVPPHGIPNNTVSSAQQQESNTLVPAQSFAETIYPQNDVAATNFAKMLSAQGLVDKDGNVNAQDPRLQKFAQAGGSGVTPNGGTAGNAPGFQQPATAPTAPGMDIGTAQRLESAAATLRARAAGVAKFDQQGAASLDKQADAYDKRAQSIRENILKNSELTPEQRNAAASGISSPIAYEQRKMDITVGGKNAEATPEQKNAATSGGMSPLSYEGMKEVQKQDVDAFNKRYTGIQALGESAENGIQKAQLMKQLTLDPNFYSGPLHEGVQTYNQFKAIFGQNPSSALPQEAFNKVTNDMLTEQIKAMGQSGVGRVLMAEVVNMKNALASLGITPQSNRALAEFSMRVYKQNQDIAELARNVPQKPGQMNRSLDTAITQYLKAHPLFNKTELAHPETLGAPDAPPESAKWSPQQRQAWAKSVGLKSGDAIRFNGQIGTVP